MKISLEKMKKWMMRKVRLPKCQMCIVGYLILELGNDILRMLGVDQPVEDLGVFFR